MPESGLLCAKTGVYFAQMSNKPPTTTERTVEAKIFLPETMAKEICERARSEGVIPANPDRGVGPALRWFIIQAWQRLQASSEESVPNPQGQPVAQDDVSTA